jgi:hypothetical protein
MTSANNATHGQLPSWPATISGDWDLTLFGGGRHAQIRPGRITSSPESTARPLWLLRSLRAKGGENKMLNTIYGALAMVPVAWALAAFARVR